MTLFSRALSLQPAFQSMAETKTDVWFGLVEVGL